jgi:hypothetical protein
MEIKKGEIKMEQKIVTRKKIVKVAIGVVVILALMVTAHILVNYFNIVEVLKAIHGG